MSLTSLPEELQFEILCYLNDYENNLFIYVYEKQKLLRKVNKHGLFQINFLLQFKQTYFTNLSQVLLQFYYLNDDYNLFIPFGSFDFDDVREQFKKATQAPINPWSDARNVLFIKDNYPYKLSRTKHIFALYTFYYYYKYYFKLFYKRKQQQNKYLSLQDMFSQRRMLLRKIYHSERR